MVSSTFVVLGFTYASSSPLLEKAEECLKGIANKKYTSIYAHDNQIVDTEYRFNCYGFVNHLITEISPLARDTLCQRMRQMASNVPVSYDGQPCPFNLFAIFQSLKDHPENEWSWIPIKNIQPGDLLIYQPVNYSPPKKPDLSKPSGTHAMIVQKIGLISQDVQHFSVIDCTRGHHRADTSGIGVRDLSVRYNSSNKTYSIKWCTQENWLEKDLCAGRLKG